MDFPGQPNLDRSDSVKKHFKGFLRDFRFKIVVALDLDVQFEHCTRMPRLGIADERCAKTLCGSIYQWCLRTRVQAGAGISYRWITYIMKHIVVQNIVQYRISL